LGKEEHTIMCGITGIVDLKNFVREERDTLIGMTETLTTSGVADLWFSTFVGFGYKCLSDRGTVQKKVNGNMYAIVYSGSLSNTKDIRHKLLEKGHSIPSSSDAETVLTSYIEWQEDCLDFLVGNFVFAVWDDNKQELFLTTSQGSNKSIYYALDSHRFLFGTELDAIVKHHKVSLENIKELQLRHSLLFSKDIVKLIKT
jgi:asparagine synthase (glutamine-hydrolysing)